MMHRISHLQKHKEILQEISACEEKISLLKNNIQMESLEKLAEEELNYAQLLFSYYEKRTFPGLISHLNKAMLVCIDAMEHALAMDLIYFDFHSRNSRSRMIFKHTFNMLANYLYKKTILNEDEKLNIYPKSKAQRDAKFIDAAFQELPDTAKIKLRGFCYHIQNSFLNKANFLLTEMMQSLAIPIKRNIAATGDNFLILENQSLFYNPLRRNQKLTAENKLILSIWLPDEKFQSAGRISFETTCHTQEGSIWQTPITYDNTSVHLNDYVSLSSTKEQSTLDVLQKNYKKDYLKFFTHQLKEAIDDQIIPPLMEIIGEYSFTDPIHTISWLKELDKSSENRSPSFTLYFYDINFEKFWGYWQYIYHSQIKNADCYSAMNANYIKSTNDFYSLANLIHQLLIYVSSHKLSTVTFYNPSNITNFLKTLINLKSYEQNTYPYVKNFVNPDETPSDELMAWGDFHDQDNSPQSKNSCIIL